VGGNPLSRIDPFGLDTVVIISDGGILPIFDHSATFVDNGGDPVLFDPGGSFNSGIRGSGDFFSGEEANLNKFVEFQKSDGSKVTQFRFSTTAGEEASIVDRIISGGGVSPGLCAVATSSVLSGVGPFMSFNGSRTPGGIENELRSLCESRKEICEIK